jgi:hypothetical protein
MNDYETDQSWMHATHGTLKSNDPSTFDKILKQEAQRVGQQWSITSKWTSYVAVDRVTTQLHEISLFKAESVEVSELMRPRKNALRTTSTTSSQGPRGRPGDE